jgi:hypothetical protein
MEFLPKEQWNYLPWGKVTGLETDYSHSSVFQDMNSLTLSDPMSNLVRHYDFPVPDTFLDL